MLDMTWLMGMTGVGCVGGQCTVLTVLYCIVLYIYLHTSYSKRACAWGIRVGKIQ